MLAIDQHVGAKINQRSSIELEHPIRRVDCSKASNARMHMVFLTCPPTSTQELAMLRWYFIAQVLGAWIWWYIAISKKLWQYLQCVWPEDDRHYQEQQSSGERHARMGAKEMWYAHGESSALGLLLLRLQHTGTLSPRYPRSEPSSGLL
jgi:hypothetical protein